MEKIKWILNQMPKNEDKNLAVMALDNVNQARKFHRSFPQYSVTPLAKLDGMAGQLGLGGLSITSVLPIPLLSFPAYGFRETFSRIFVLKNL